MKHQAEEYVEVGFDDFIPKPFRFEQICECLAKVLEVEYEYEEQTRTDRDAAPEIDVTEVVLPDALRARLTEAAELYNLTQLNRCIDEVAQLGGDAHPLAEHLRELARNHDMDGIHTILSATQNEREA